MNLQWLYVNGILPALYPKTHGGLGSLLRAERRASQESLAKNRREQWSRLKRLLEHAYATCPFYTERFDAAGLKPRDINSPADFAAVPVLTREDLQHHLQRIKSSAFQDSELSQSGTGGTTDISVPILRDKTCIAKKLAGQFLFNSWAGAYSGDKVLYLWGARTDFAQNPSWRWRAYERYLMRRVWLPVSLFNEEIFEHYREELNSFRPRAIFSYCTPLQLFCEYLRSCGKPYHRPQTIICTAEQLLDTQRELMESVFGCQVFNHYGSRETGMIASECACHSGMHLNSRAAYLDLVPVPGGESEHLHEMLFTDLLNYGAPLIRYRINDCVFPTEEECACGSGFPLLGRIAGRVADVFPLPNGDIMPVVTVMGKLIKACPGVLKMQFIQHKVDQVEILYVPSPIFRPSDLELFTAGCRTYFGEQVHVRFTHVSGIAREPSGKTRVVISHVRRNAMTAATTVLGAKAN